MTYDKVLRSLDELVSIHKELIDSSNKTTENIKVGKVDELQDQIMHERKLSLKLEQAEEKRQAVVEAWFSANDIQSDEMTITEMLANIVDEEKQIQLASVTTKLTEAITTLKRSEQLNRELLEQSMQFVQMSLQLLSPDRKSTR